MAHEWAIEDDHHRHPLMRATDGGPFRCLGCREMGCGPRYSCVEEECGYVLHEDCAHPDATITHPLLCDALVTNSRRCGARLGAVNCFVYCCPERDLDLHPCCAKMELRMVVEDERGSITFLLRDGEIAKCHSCMKQKLDRYARSWTYVSGCGKYHFHVRCMKEVVEALQAAVPGGLRGAAIESSSRAPQVERWPASLQVARRNAKKGKFTLPRKIVQFAISYIRPRQRSAGYRSIPYSTPHK